MFFTVPLPADFAIGWGNYTEFGLGTHYSPGWALAADTQQTTIRQVTLNPNVAYKFTDWMSASVGIRESWIQFENYKQPNAGENFWYANGQLPGGGMYMPALSNAYNLRTRLKGEDWATGWNAALDFKLTDDLSVGVVYRSKIKHKIRGDFDMTGSVNTPLGTLPASQVAASQGYSASSRASAWLELPQSLTFGANYKVTDRYRVGSSITWTDWSSVDTINFAIPNGPGGGYRLPLNWKDTVRVGFGMEYDLLDWLTVRCGYTFDEDPTSKKHSTTMLPCGDRHIIGSGLGFKLAENLYLDFGYSFIRMNNEHYPVAYARADGTAGSKRYSTRNGHSHLVSASLRYSF
jgi:long-chain fatty acid transport protein